MPKLIFNHHSDVTAAVLALPAQRVAIGLDFDGTLAPFNDDRDAVRIPQTTKNSIIRLSEVLNGAVAIVTGRDAAFIEGTIFQDFLIPASYGHGAFVRKNPNDELEKSAIDIDEHTLDKLLSAQTLPENVHIEVKPQARALHWNKSGLPEQIIEPMVREIVDRVVQTYNEQYPEDHATVSQLKAEAGRMVYEIGSAHASKGHAIELFSAIAPFQGRTFVYFGDQPADRSAMDVVNAQGGISVGVGRDSPFSVHYRLQGPEDVQKVLKALADNKKWAGVAAPKPGL